MEILRKTLDEMPDRFTSNQFNKQAVKNGFSEERLKRKGLSNYLRRYADNEYFGSKTWIKKQKIKKTNHSFIESTNVESISQAITILKKHGYKVMKPTTAWEEI
jgi:hypothetical protein